MSFSSVTFLFYALPLFLGTYYLCPIRWRKHALIVCSLLFYAWSKPLHVLLLIALIGYVYAFGRWINAYQTQKDRYRALALGCCLLVFFLIYFKYYDIFLQTISDFMQSHPRFQALAMPLGLSFILFQAISYLADIAMQKAAASSLLDCAYYLTFFPKVLMGPIMPYHAFIKINKELHPSYEAMETGAKAFVRGLAWKLILANTFAALYAQAYMDESVVGAWLSALAYTLQLYFDFAGYSLMATGIANLFGVTLMENFNHPYRAASIRDFWHRWHISLSQWFRDYVYIPLKGSRTTKIKHIRNILIVWILTGLWHGNSWNFLLWGLYYGGLLIIEAYLCKGRYKHPASRVAWLVTFLLVMIGWVLFANADVSIMMFRLGLLFGCNAQGLISDQSLFLCQTYWLWLILAWMVESNYFHMKIQTVLGSWKYRSILELGGYTALLLICIAYLVATSFQSFLYFQF